MLASVPFSDASRTDRAYIPLFHLDQHSALSRPSPRVPATPTRAARSIIPLGRGPCSLCNGFMRSSAEPTPASVMKDHSLAHSLS